MEQANKLLRRAKSNIDGGLRFHALYANSQNIIFLGYNDASFDNRKDLSSQGGFLVGMAAKETISGHIGHIGVYNVVAWRSWRLPRVIRNSLSTEPQTILEYTNSILFISPFRNYFGNQLFH